ncbi:MAG TPA: hypothetical protein VJB57_08265 [Dehalococcoidia bacterium]|nr:hypothetical protein [Dehalococcoidia bacterium]
MTIGLSPTAIIRDVESELGTLDKDQAQLIAKAVAAAIEKNNQEIDRELGRRFADVERKIGRG